MRMVRGRAEARWLPSRHHFALFRLGGYLRLRSAKPEPKPHVMLAVDRDQSAFEGYGVSAWLLVTVACYVYFELSSRMAWPLALLLAAPLASLALQIPLFFVGAVLAPLVSGAYGHNARVNSIATVSLQIVVASYYATERAWVRFAGWQFLFFVALNALAAIVLFALRADVARLEASYVTTSGGTSSES